MALKIHEPIYVSRASTEGADAKELAMQIQERLDLQKRPGSFQG